MTDKVDVLDLANNVDLDRMERILTTHPDNTLIVIYSPYILLVWEDVFKIVRVKYFEKQSEGDMKLAEDILNGQKVIHKDFDVRFPYAFMTWKE